jgi:YVTN family beta-propeller protein
MKKEMIRWMLPVLLMAACKKEDAPVQPVPITPAKGVYVLSEGGFGSNNSKLAYRSLSTGLVSGDFFLQQNPSQTAGLGDLANDAILYGGKMYILINGSGNVVVTDANTGVFITRINFLASSLTRFPRYAVPYKGKVYVSATDGTVNAIDTTTLGVVKTINVGPNPEGMAIVGSSLYVANSGGYNAVPDSTVSVINLNTDTEITKITIGTKNPQFVQASTSGEIYVSGYGNFTSIPASISIINSASNSVMMELGTTFSYSHCRVSGDVAYFFNNYGGAGTCKVYNTITHSVVRSEFITDGTVITTPYGVNIDEENGDVYIMDAKDYISAGEVTCFNKDGVKKFSFSVAPGLNPNKVVFAR